MKLINKTTGIVEFDGPAAQFPGIDVYQHEEVNAEFELICTAEEQRASLRDEITVNAGDTESLLGTATDGMHMLLYQVAKMSAQLSTAESLAQVRAAAQELNTLLAGFAAKVDSQEVKLPYQTKGVDVVLQDIESRATAVNQLIAEAS
ncbi:hypothetical protein [Thalassomonas sp. RHCl1]|uniref:hypothetical protein n=1 Tax=Thalassomonas sp. RHCl1 TaxID=2995320 RepID=UPI00248C9C15|nr:hypothetical protein [Thalassomonas sp. RHCl1]